jgi:ATP-dependent DNA ligase
MSISEVYCSGDYSHGRSPESSPAKIRTKLASLSSKLKTTLPLPQFTPASPRLRPTAFDHEDYIFELKMDGFRALAHVGPDETRLVSRKVNV